MKRKLIITINAEFGSKFQYESAKNALVLMIEAWKSFYLSTHKKNKITSEYEDKGV